MNPQPHAKKLPEGFRLGKTPTLLTGNRWYVERLSDGKQIVRNQDNPKIAVERALPHLQ